LEAVGDTGFLVGKVFESRWGWNTNVRGNSPGFFQAAEMLLHDGESALVAVGTKASGVFNAGRPVAASNFGLTGFAPGWIFAQGGFVLDESSSFQLAVFFGCGVGDENAFPEGDGHGLLGLVELRISSARSSSAFARAWGAH
jgi:hypothetical protein